MKFIRSNKKGVLGIGTVGSVIIALLTIAVLSIAMFLSLVSIGDSVGRTETTDAATLNNETLTTVYEVGEDLSVATLRGVLCTILFVTNATDGVAVPASNRTTTNCNLAYSGDTGDVFNNTNWNVSYTYTRVQDTGTGYIVNNLTAGPIEFFSNSSTFFVLLGVVVLVLIIAIVIVAVKGFNGSGITAGATGVDMDEL